MIIGLARVGRGVVDSAYGDRGIGRFACPSEHGTGRALPGLDLTKEVR